MAPSCENSQPVSPFCNTPAALSTDPATPNPIAQKAGVLSFLGRILRDRNLYGSLAFAETAESLRLNLHALQVGCRDRVVGVTSSGDLLLTLLASGPEAVLGFDANSTQTALTHLKSAAIAALSVENYLQLMGVYAADPAVRIELFGSVSQLIPQAAQRDLRLSIRQIEKGILNCGMTHLMIGAFVSICRTLLGTETTALLLGICGNDNDRIEALNQLHARRSMRCLIQPMLKCLAPVLKWLFFPHRFCRISRRPNAIIADPLTAFRDVLVQGLKKNPVLCRSATGHIHPEWIAHLYNDDTFQSIRAHRSRLTLDSADILTGLSRVDNGWATKVYLSNVPDYLSTRELDMLMRELRRAADPDARIVYYSLYDQDLLRPLGTPLPNQELRVLRDSDTVAIYPFIMVRRNTLQ